MQIYTMVHKIMCHFYFLIRSTQHWLILIIFALQNQKKLDANCCTSGHLTLILSLHYLVKCRLLILLFASGVNVCHLHWHWRKILSTCCNKENVT